jgi:hypothetical protein
MEWHLFFSQTFRKGRTFEGARAQFYRCHADVLSRLIPKAMFWVLEPHKRKTTYHVHGLLSLTSINDFPRCKNHEREYRAKCPSCAQGRAYFLALLNLSWKYYGTLRTSFMTGTTSQRLERAVTYATKYCLKSEGSDAQTTWNMWTKPDGPLYTRPVRDWGS